MLLREPELLGERLHRRPEALVAQHDRLEVEREVAQRADRVPVPLRAPSRAPRRLLEPPAFERVDHGVEHQRDPRQRLHRPVVEEEREPAPLLLLGGDQLVGQARALRLAHLRLGEQARVLDGAAGEVGEQRSRGRAPRGRMAEPATSCSAADLLAADAQRDSTTASSVAAALALGRRQNASRVAVEQAARLVPGAGRGSSSGSSVDAIARHRLDQRLEEARLRRRARSSTTSWRRRSVTIRCSAKPAAPTIADDQADASASRARPDREPDEREHDAAGRQHGDQQRRSSR